MFLIGVEGWKKTDTPITYGCAAIQVDGKVYNALSENVCPDDEWQEHLRRHVVGATETPLDIHLWGRKIWRVLVVQKSEIGEMFLPQEGTIPKVEDSRFHYVLFYDPESWNAHVERCVDYGTMQIRAWMVSEQAKAKILADALVLLAWRNPVAAAYSSFFLDDPEKGLRFRLAGADEDDKRMAKQILERLRGTHGA